MNRPRTAKNQTQKSPFQKLAGKLCPKPLIWNPASHGKLKNTHSIHLNLEKNLSSTSNQSRQNALTHGPSKTLLD